MLRLRVRKIGRAEIVAAFEWYLERSPVAAKQFLDAVHEAMSVIEESPERHPVIRGHFRRGYCEVLPRRVQQGFSLNDQPDFIQAFLIYFTLSIQPREKGLCRLSVSQYGFSDFGQNEGRPEWDLRF